MKNYYNKILKSIHLNYEKAKDILTKKEKISLKDIVKDHIDNEKEFSICLLYTSPSPRDNGRSRMPSSA